MAYRLSNIDHISELHSEIHYIKRFICRISGDDGNGEGEYQVYIYFSLEYRPVGLPEVSIKFIDEPSPELTAAMDAIATDILKMEKSGILKHSPFEEL